MNLDDALWDIWDIAESAATCTSSEPDRDRFRQIAHLLQGVGNAVRTRRHEQDAAEGAGIAGTAINLPPFLTANTTDPATGAPHAADAAAIAAARREQEAREIIERLTFDGAPKDPAHPDECLFCSADASAPGVHHDDDCYYGKARAWLAAQGAETDHAP